MTRLMHLLIYLPLAIPLLAAASARRLAELLPPRTATWLLVVSALALAAASCAVLGLLALSAALRIPLVDSITGMSLRAVNRADQASVPLGVLAGALLAAAALAAVRAAWLRAAALIGAHRQTRALAGAARGVRGAREAVVVPDDGVDAYTVPGWPSRIVVTSGMFEALNAAERDVLLAHERAHAAGHHYLFTAAVRLAAAANPLLSPLAAAVGYSVERWADEAAAATAGSRPLTARTIAKAALAATAAPARRAPAFAVLGVLPRRAAARRWLRGASPGPAHRGPSQSHRASPRRFALRGGPGLVPRRVAALLEPPPRSRLLLVVLAVALVALSCLSALDVAGELHHLIEAAQAAGS
jgi:Zn-dependent protease with chaperone function